MTKSVRELLTHNDYDPAHSIERPLSRRHDSAYRYEGGCDVAYACHHSALWWCGPFLDVVAARQTCPARSLAHGQTQADAWLTGYAAMGAQVSSATDAAPPSTGVFRGAFAMDRAAHKRMRQM